MDEFAETLRRINSMEASWRELDDSGLEAAVAELRRRAQTWCDPDAWMLEVFAAIRELAHRSIGLRPFDEQLTAGLAALYHIAV